MFKETLKELRTERALSQKALANSIGFAQSVVSDWEKGTKEPTMAAIIALSRFFEVSADYLLGLEDEWGEKAYDAPSLPTVSKDEYSILELYRKVDPKDRSKIATALELYADMAEARAATGNKKA